VPKAPSRLLMTGPIALPEGAEPSWQIGILA